MSKKNKKNEAINEPSKGNINEAENDKVDNETIEEKLQGELKNEKDKFLRLFAEFENYKKRTNKERIELFKTASMDVMVSFGTLMEIRLHPMKEQMQLNIKNHYLNTISSHR